MKKVYISCPITGHDMKNKLITLLKSIGIMVAFITAALIIGMLSGWSYYLHLSIVIITFVVGIYHFYRQMRPKKRYYFVSYAYNKGFASFTTTIEGPVFQIMAVTEFIKKNYLKGEGCAAIIFYKELSKEEYESQKAIPCEK